MAVPQQLIPKRVRRTSKLAFLAWGAALVVALYGEATYVFSHLYAPQPSTERPAPGAAAAASRVRQPPQPPPLFNGTAESIGANMRALIDSDRRFVDDLVARIGPSDATFANVLLPSAQNANLLSRTGPILGFYAAVSASKPVRDASDAASRAYDEYAVEASMRQDYFALVAAIRNNATDRSLLDAESARLLDCTYQDHLDNGLGLREGGPERRRYRNISATLDALATDFARNLNEDNGSIWLSREELAGAPPDLYGGWEKGTGGENAGKFRLVLRNPEERIALQQVRDGEVRRRILVARENSTPENVPLFERAVELRDEGARLLGFPNHAAFRLQRRLLDGPEKVERFLEEVRERLVPRGLEEMRNLTEAKRGDGERNEGNDMFFAWDQSYYETRFLAEGFDLDPEKVKEYFPSTVIIQEMLQIYSQLFGLQFEEVRDADLDALSPSGKGEDIVWHPDVQLFSVWDSEAEGGEFVGYLYLDLFPRDGKYGHAANFNLQPGFLDLDNDRKRYYPATALVCNFPKPTAEKPSLMSHSNVVTIFHELGHGIHALVTRTTYSYFHANNIVWDFVETPSQMLENWAWTPAVLKNLTRHYSYLSEEYKQTWLKENNATDPQQPVERMPDEMINNLSLNKNYNIGLRNLRQIAFATFDMTVHTPATHQEIVDLDITTFWNQNMKNVSLMNYMEELIQDESKKWAWGHGQTTFGHLMGAYDAGYYGYLSSKVYAQDMFYTVFKKDPFNPEEGRRYRHTLLEKGGSVAPMKLITEFLGREPNQDAFFEDMGFR